MDTKETDTVTSEDVTIKSIEEHITFKPTKILQFEGEVIMYKLAIALFTFK